MLFIVYIPTYIKYEERERQADRGRDKENDIVRKTKIDIEEEKNREMLDKESGHGGQVV